MRKSNIRTFILGFIKGLAAAKANPYEVYKLEYKNTTVIIGINQGISHIDGNINYAANNPDKAQFDLYNTANYKRITTESRLSLDELIDYIENKSNL